MPIVRGDLAADAEVAADVEQQAADAAAPVQRGLAGPLDDVALGDRVEAERAVRQALGGAGRRVEPPGGPRS